MRFGKVHLATATVGVLLAGLLAGLPGAQARPPAPVAATAAVAAVAEPAARVAVAATTISGQVRAADTRAGLGGYRVGAWAAGDPEWRHATTDRRGRYRLTGLLPGVEYTIQVSRGPSVRGPYLDVWAPGVVPGRLARRYTAPATVDVRLPRGIAVAGTFTSATRPRTPEPDTTVYLVGADDTQVTVAARVEASGRWSAAVPPGRYLVVVPEVFGEYWYGGAGRPVVENRTRAAVVRVAAGRPVPPVRLREPAPAQVRVHAVDAGTGRPVPACAAVGFSPWDPADHEPGSTSDPLAVRAFGWGCSPDAPADTVTLDPGPGLVQVYGNPDYVARTVPVRAQRGRTKDYTVRLSRAGHVTGRAVDARTGRTLQACATVSPASSPPPVADLALDQPFGCAFADDEPAFTVDSVPPGRVRVSADAGGHPRRWAPDADSTATAGTFTVTAGKVTDIGTVRLQPAGAVTGRVLDARGKPLAGALVGLPGPAFLEPWGGTTVVTGIDGRYRLKDLPAGYVRLRVTPPRRTGLAEQWLGGPGEDEATPVAVRWGTTTTAPTVRLAAGAALQVRVSGADPTVTVEAFDAGGRPVGAPAVVDRRGVARLTGLPAVPLRLHAWSWRLLPQREGWAGGQRFGTAAFVRPGQVGVVQLALRNVPARASTTSPLSPSALQGAGRRPGFQLPGRGPALVPGAAGAWSLARPEARRKTDGHVE